jgi:hypothetical protein
MARSEISTCRKCGELYHYKVTTCKRCGSDFVAYHNAIDRTKTLWVVFHCTDSDDGPKTVELRGVTLYHVNDRLWNAPGYNLGGEKVNGVYVWSTMRPLDMPGAHATGLNSISVGMTLVGKFDKTAPTDEQTREVLTQGRKLLSRYNLDTERFIGHREVFEKTGKGPGPVLKTCPGKKWDMDELRRML